MTKKMSMTFIKKFENAVNLFIPKRKIEIRIKVRAGVQDLQKIDGSLTENNKEKANTLADYFTSFYSTESSNDNTEIREYCQIKIEHLHIDANIVRKS